MWYLPCITNTGRNLSTYSGTFLIVPIPAEIFLPIMVPSLQYQDRQKSIVVPSPCISPNQQKVKKLPYPRVGRRGSNCQKSSSRHLSITVPSCKFVDVVLYLGHHISFDLSDSADILSKTCDLVKKPNLMLFTFSVASPAVKSRLFQCYYLSLYGSSFWNLSCPALRSIEVSFNNILRRIWRLPRNCHTGILHLTARLPSNFNQVLSRLTTLLFNARSCPSPIVRLVFQASSSLIYTSFGHNVLVGDQHIKSYSFQDGLCANVIRGLYYGIDYDINNYNIFLLVPSLFLVCFIYLDICTSVGVLYILILGECSALWGEPSRGCDLHVH